MIAAALLRDLCVGAEALPLIDRSPEGGGKRHRWDARKSCIAFEAEWRLKIADSFNSVSWHSSWRFCLEAGLFYLSFQCFNVFLELGHICL